MALKGSIRVQFDRFLAPNTANRQAFCVNAGRPEECISAGSGPGSITFSVEYDPVDRVVVMKPQQRLMPMTRYNVRLLPPKNDSDTSGIRAFDGVAVDRGVPFAFTTGDASASAAEPNRAIDFCTAARPRAPCLTRVPPTPVGESRQLVHRGYLRWGAKLSQSL